VFGINQALKKNKLKMKKILLILVAALGLTATAQTGFKKSDKFVEGTFSYEKTKDVDATYTFAPTVGYFLTDKTAVGISVETGNVTKTSDLHTGEVTTTTGKHFCTTVFARHYFLNAGQNFKVYSQLGISNNNDADAKAYFSTDLGLGLNYFVTKNLALTTSLTSLASYNDQTSTFTVGFTGVDNPFSKTTFGAIYKF